MVILLLLIMKMDTIRIIITMKKILLKKMNVLKKKTVIAQLGNTGMSSGGPIYILKFGKMEKTQI
ncbi:MAG: hypothetical protein CM1200mP31_0120 [Candidatus Neomarinimicrobiota bacterium]|nr:MAG: hypothetical protein CM1200mP31_0120 [Candidatus Neomarinimicrobiota bacterium]